MKIEWTNPGVSDLQHIRDYIARDSEFFAHRFTERIIDTISTLPQFPKMGRFVPEAEDESIRELIFQNYRIIYRVEQERILILAIIHGGRDLRLIQPKPWEIV